MLAEHAPTVSSRRRWAAATVAVAMPSLFVVGALVQVRVTGDSNFALAFPVVLTGWVGALLMVRVPDNRIGWILSLGGLAGAVSGIAAALVPSTETPLPAPPELSSSQLIGGLGFGAIGWFGLLAVWLVGVPLLFPSGRPPSPRWRWIGWVGGIAISLAGIFSLFAPELCDQWTVGDPVSEPGTRLVAKCFDNPIGVAFMPSAEDGLAGSILTLAFISSLVGALASLVVRFRRAGRGPERAQIKWVLFSLGAIVTMIVLSTVVESLWGEEALPASDLPMNVAFSSLPVAIAVAILRYRLYEIDRIISRAISYVLVVGLLGSVFFGAVAAVALLPTESSLGVAASTLVVAVLFNPLRKRVQDRVDRRFNRARYDVQQVMDRFSGSLTDRLDGVSLVGGWQTVVATTMEPSTISIWVRETDSPPAAAAYRARR